jgi:dethiobiotin synthetase
MNGLMIVGTDTGVGKTTLCELLLADAVARSASVGIYKPVCTGSDLNEQGGEIWSDVERLYRASGERYRREEICPQRFHAPLAPPVAAAIEGQRVDSALLTSGLDRWRQSVDTLIVEGVGGLLCPVTEQLTIADLARHWNTPIVVVAANRLGTINHTLLTLEVAERRGLLVAGWVLNHLQADDGASAISNAREIRQRTSVPFLGEIPFQAGGELQTAHSSSRMFIGRDVRSLGDILSLARQMN